jgi:hypothetical protein
MRPARRRLVFLSAALAAVAAVLALVLPHTMSPAAVHPAAENAIGVSHSETIFTVGVSQPVSAGESRCEGLPRPQFAAGACVAAEDATTDAGEEGTQIYRGVSEAHHAYDAALEGVAEPGDPLGTADPLLHNLGETETSRLVSFSTDRAVAEGFAGKDGVILQTTLEDLAARGITPIASPDLYYESELLFEGPIGGLGVVAP